jgi:hypothetical protein
MTHNQRAHQLHTATASPFSKHKKIEPFRTSKHERRAYLATGYSST